MWMEMGLKPGARNDLLRIDGIKASSDGSNQAGTTTRSGAWWNWAFSRHHRRCLAVAG
ncbi:hypothetical protein [Tessaracoccus sp.]